MRTWTGREWRAGLPALMIYLGIGLLFFTVTLGFLRAIYWIALPAGLGLLVLGVLGVLFREREG